MDLGRSLTQHPTGNAVLKALPASSERLQQRRCLPFSGICPQSLTILMAIFSPPCSQNISCSHCCPFCPRVPLGRADPKLLIKHSAPSLTSTSIFSTPSPYRACWGSPHPVPPAYLSPSAWQPCPTAHWLCPKFYLLPANLPNFKPPLSSTYPAHL